MHMRGDTKNRVDLLKWKKRELIIYLTAENIAHLIPGNMIFIFNVKCWILHNSRHIS